MLKKILLLSLVTILITSCNSDNDPKSGKDEKSFDRGVMLTNLADNIIIPAYTDLDAKLNTLVTAKDNFITTSDQSNLDKLRTSWLAAYKTWQSVEMFNIGKAEEILYHFQMNVYPTNIIDIQSNIESGTYDLMHSNNNDAVGFPAVDYMLYGIGDDDTAILNTLADEKHKKYLSDIIDQMKSLTETVLNDWNGSYKSTFIASTTNTATSAVNLLVNDFIFYYEKGLRANKVGIPAGNFSATPLPEKVEAFFRKDVSKQLTLDALQAVQNLFNGKHYDSNSTGEGLKTYLNFLKRSELATTINTKFDAAREKINGLDNNFYTQITTDNTKMTQSYDALQAAVVLIKVDMLQAFNISIDYIDADGD
jgi:predicted lipoprotein